MSPVLPFDKWSETEGASFDGLEELREYGNYYRTSSFAETGRVTEDAQEVDNELIQLANSRGYLSSNEDGAIDTKEYFQPANKLDQDLFAVHSHLESQGFENDAATIAKYSTLRNLPDADPELLSEYEANVASLITPEEVSKARRANVESGSVPFSAHVGEDGELDIKISPQLTEGLDPTAIATFAKANPDYVDPRLLDAVAYAFEDSEDLAVPRYKLQQTADFQRHLADTESVDSKFLNENLEDLNDLYSKNHNVDGAIEALANSYKGPFAKEVVIANLKDSVVARGVDQRGEPAVLSTGEIRMPSSTLVNSKLHEEMLSTIEGVTEGQKEFTRKNREANLEAMAPDMHDVALTFGKIDYFNFYNDQKAKGVSDGKIIEEWFSDEDNYSAFANRASGVFNATLNSTPNIVYMAQALSGDDEARKVLTEQMSREAKRKKYGAMFGDELGFGYEVARVAPEIAADIGLGLITGGVYTTTATAGKATLKTALKASLKASLKLGTKEVVEDAIATGASKSISNALLKLEGDILEKSVINTAARNVAAIAPSTFTRSAGMSYVSSYSALEEMHPEWSPEKIRGAALGHAVTSGVITTGITLGFSSLAHAFPKIFSGGVEEWVTKGTGGMTTKQLNQAYSIIKKNPSLLPEDLKGFVDTSTFKSFFDTLAKNGSRSVMGDVAKGAASEYLEEGLDQFIGYYRDNQLTDTKSNILEGLAQAHHAGMVGAVFGATGGVTESGVFGGPNVDPDRVNSLEDQAYTDLADTLANSGDEASSQFLRSQIFRAAQDKQSVRRTINSTVEETTAAAKSAEAGADLVSEGFSDIRLTEAQAKGRLSQVTASLKEFPENPNPEQFAQRAGLLRIQDTLAKTVADASLQEAGVEQETSKDGSSILPSVVPNADTSTPEGVDSALEEVRGKISTLENMKLPKTKFQEGRLRDLISAESELEKVFPKQPDPTTTTTSFSFGNTDPAVQAAKLRDNLSQVETTIAGITKQFPSAKARNASIVSTLKVLRATKKKLKSELGSFGQAGVVPFELAGFGSQGGTPTVTGLTSDARSLPPVPSEDADGQFTFGIEQRIDEGAYKPKYNFDPTSVSYVGDAEALRVRQEETLDNLTTTGQAPSHRVKELALEDQEAALEELTDELPIREVVEASPLVTADPDKELNDPVRNAEDALQLFIDFDNEPVLSEDEIQEIVTELEEELGSASAPVVGDSIDAVNLVEANADSLVGESVSVEGTPAVVISVESGIVSTASGDVALASIPVDELPAELAAQVTEVVADRGTDSQNAEPDLTPTDTTPAPPRVKKVKDLVKAAIVKADQEGVTTREILEDHVQDVKASYTIAGHIVPLYNLPPITGKKKYYVRGTRIFVANIDRATEKIVEDGDVYRVANKKTGKVDKRKKVDLLDAPSLQTLRDPETGEPRFLRPEDETLFNEIVDSGIPPRLSHLKSLVGGLASHHLTYTSPFINTATEEIRKRWPEADLTPPEGATKVEKSAKGAASQAPRLILERVITFRRGNNRRDVWVKDLESRLKELDAQIEKSKYDKFTNSFMNALDRAKKLEMELTDSEAEVLRNILSTNEAANLDRQSSRLVDIANQGVLSEQERLVALEEAQSKVETATLIRSDVGDSDTTKTPAIEKALVARARVQSSAQKLYKGSPIRSLHKQRLQVLEDLFDTKQLSDSLRVEVDLSPGLAGKNSGRYHSAYQDRQRRIRGENNIRYTHGGTTHNLNIPFFEMPNGSLEPAFTNDPAATATALNLGFSVKAPKSFKRGSKKLNPAITVGVDGYVKSAIDPITMKEVERPGDLATFGSARVYTPAALKSASQQAYLAGLPPVKPEFFSLVGPTPIGVFPEQVSSDDVYLTHAFDFLEGRKGQVVRNLKDTSTPKLEAARTRLAARFLPKIEALSTEIDALELRLSRKGKLSIDLTENLTAAESALADAQRELAETEARVGRSISAKAGVGTRRTNEVNKRILLLDEAREDGDPDEIASASEALEEAQEKLNALETTQAEEFEALVKEIDDAKLVEKRAASSYRSIRKEQDAANDANEALLQEALQGKEYVDPAEDVDALKKDILRAQEERANLRIEHESYLAKAYEDSSTTSNEELSNQQVPADVSELVNLASRAGADAGEATQYVMHQYQLGLREFGLAMRTLQRTQDGKDVVSWLENEFSEEVLSQLRTKWRNKGQKKLTNKQALRAYADYLVSMVTPSKDPNTGEEVNSRFYKTSTQSAHPPTLRSIVEQVKKSYISALPNSPVTVDFNSPVSDGTITPDDIISLERSLSEVYDETSGAIRNLSLGAEDLFDRAVGFMNKNEDALAAARKIGNGLGIRSSGTDSPRDLWSKVHDIILRSPEVLSEMSPDTRALLSPFYRAIIPSEVGSIKVMADETVEESIDNYSALFRQTNIPANRVSQGMSSLDVYRVLQRVAGQNSAPLNIRATAQALTNGFKSFDMPTVDFVRDSSASLAPWKAIYSRSSQSATINLTKPEDSARDTLVRAALQHVATSSVAVDPSSAESKALLSAAKEVIAVFPEAGTTFEEGIQFAMVDPVAKRASISNVRKAVGELVGTNPTQKSSAAALSSPSLGTPMSGRSYKKVTDAPVKTIEEAVQRALPNGVQVSYEESGPNPAWVSSHSPNTVYLNPVVLNEMIDGFPQEVQEKVIGRIVGHEVAHLASLKSLTNEDRATIYNEMSEVDRKLAAKRSPVASGKVVLAEEFLRMRLEESLYGSSSDVEVHRLLTYGDGMLGKLVSYIQKFAASIRGYLSGRHNPALAAHLERLTMVVEEIERGAIPADPQDTTDISSLQTDIVSAMDSGSNQRFYSLPIVGSDPSVVQWFEDIGGRLNVVKEIRDVVNSYQGKLESLEYEAKSFAIDLQKISTRLRREGVEPPAEDINFALGNTGATLTLDQKKELDRLRELDAKNKLNPESIASRHAARVEAAELNTIRSREVDQERAMARLRALDPELARVVGDFRNLVSEQSREVGKIYDGGEMSSTFDRNGNVYLHRRYEFFLTEGWAASARSGKRVGNAPKLDWAGMRAEAIAAIQEDHMSSTGKKISESEARDNLNSWLHNLHKFQESNLGTINQASKETGMFKDKTDLPTAIEKIMGAIDSPVVNAVDTHIRLGKYLATNKMLENLGPQLLSSGIAHKTEISPDGVDLVPILGNTRSMDPEYAPIHGLYATEEDAKAIRSELSISSARSADGVGDSVINAAGKKLALVAGASMTMKTLGSVGFYTRNIMSNVFFFLPMQGVWGPQFTKGFKATELASQASLKGTVVEKLNSKFVNVVGNDVANEARIKRLTELGVLHSDVRAEVIREIYQLGHDGKESYLMDVSNWIDGEPPSPWVKKIIGNAKESPKAVPELLAKINNTIDGSAKVVLFDHELSVLKKVRDETGNGKTDTQLEEEAAKKVGRTMPGHAEVNPIVTSFTKSGAGKIIMPFARFKAETVRVFFETHKLALEEIKEGNSSGSKTLRNRGIRRLTSQLATTAVMSKIVAGIYGTVFSLLAEAVSGDDTEDKEDDRLLGFGSYAQLSGEARSALRGALPDWQRNATLFTKVDGDEISIMDMTYINPFSLVADPFINFVDRSATEGLDEGVKSFAGSLVKDFIGEGIAFGAFREVLSNADDRGFKIYQKTDGIPTITRKILAHYLQGAVAPGVYTKGKQVVSAVQGDTQENDRTFDAMEIIVGEMFGARPQRRKMENLYEKSAKDAKRTLDEVGGELWPLNSKGRQDADSVSKVVEDYMSAYVKVMETHRRNQRGWEELNPKLFDKESYVRAMVNASHSRNKARQVIYGGVADRPIKGRVALRNMYKNAESEDGEGGKLRVKNYIDAVLKYPRYLPLK